MKSKTLRTVLIDLLFYILGSFIFSVAVSSLISVNEISPGGFTGIATILSYLFSVPSGIILLLLNLPVIILGFLKFGGIFILKTAVVTVISSFSLTVTDLILPAFEIDKILAAVFGGLLMGLGLSLIMLRGATTGGADIIAKLINRKHRHLTVGRIILMIDAVVITLASVIYRDVESALYSVVAMYVSSFIMDTVLYGADKGKIIHVVTSKADELCREITISLKRGITKIEVKGGYTNTAKVMLLCVVRRYEVANVYEIINRIDPTAFIVVSDAGEIIGEGFKTMK